MALAETLLEEEETAPESPVAALYTAPVPKAAAVPGAATGIRDTRMLHGPDRTVLKAFYTQYVAVLLIILTFTVGSFQRTLNVHLNEPPPPPVPLELPTIGAMALHDIFDTGGALAHNHDQLDALANVLLNHDLDLHLTVAVPRISLTSGSASFERGLRRLAILERYFESRGVPLSVLHMDLVTGDEGSPLLVDFRPSREVP